MTRRIVERLHHNRMAWGFLPQSSSPLHIWARDYMPVQVNKDKFVLFRYEPDYLKGYPEYKPDTSSILSELGIQVMRSDIILDGGNIISCSTNDCHTNLVHSFSVPPHPVRRAQTT